ncbi:hypothetical protein ALQ00_102165 [Pseudomonas syringae pv. tomato]|nr:Unknown protein sequence [Pseudomonas syringae pv. maculicola]RMQ79893.1 hypothetical protein ALQ00_102165 [Pseudomonas syringae pv. tomato]
MQLNMTSMRLLNSISQWVEAGIFSERTCQVLRPWKQI